MKTLSQRYQTGRSRAKISLTPLIDVVFILLVFFMLASNFQQERNIELTTPASGPGKRTSITDDKPIRIDIQGQGRFLVDGKQTSIADLTDILRQTPAPKLIVAAGNDSVVQDVVAFMDLA
ncbi:MAG: biopolymer transporter ExbD, partial [Sneathiella sp.]|nr:biopolymer transporter ExbD [Sneathiella sp.]